MRHKVFSSVLLASMAIWSVNAELVQIANKPYDDGLAGASGGAYRIPAMAKSTNGVVVAVYDCRYNSSGDLPNVIDLAENWSGDNGTTWSKPRVAVDVPNTNNYQKVCNIGDPCIVYDPDGDKFWLMGITGGGLASSHDGSGNSIADVVLYTRGTGENDTWQEWTGGPEGNRRSVKQMILNSLADVEGNETYRDENQIRGILQGPGHGIVQRQTVYAADGETVIMPAGAIVFPMQYFIDGNFSNTRTFAVYSTDGGAHWNATKLTPANDNAQENCVMELDDGSWYMICKGKTQSQKQRQLFRTTDFANWTYCGSITPSEWVQGSCMRIGEGRDGKSRYVACFTTVEYRSDVTLHFGRDTSNDDGATRGVEWDIGNQVVYPGATGGMSYNSLVMLDSSTLGILIEINGHIYLIMEDVSDVLERDEIDVEPPVPAAVWDGDFTAAQTGYTLNINGNKLSDDNSTVTITNTYTGLDINAEPINAASRLSNGVTLLVRYNNLVKHANKSKVIATSCNDGNYLKDRTGVDLHSENKLWGMWYNNGWADNGDKSAAGIMPASGVFAFTYEKTSGTYLYAGTSATQISSTPAFGASGLKSGSDTIWGVTVGGMRSSTINSNWRAAQDMEVTAIAVFDGVLSTEKMNAFVWPDVIVIEVSRDTSVSALNAQIAAADTAKEIFLHVSDGATITVDAPFVAAVPVFVQSKGSITLAAESRPDASYFSGVDFSGVKGVLRRTWLGTGAFGFNFYGDMGSDTSKALVDGTWQSNGGNSVGRVGGFFGDGLSELFWNSSTLYNYNSGTLMNGYLDDGSNDGNGAQIKLSNIPYETYDVIIYCATDTENARFLAKTVNGKSYTWDMASGAAVEGTGDWGRSRVSDVVYGQNAIRVNNLSGPLTIYGGIRNGSNRGGIAAFQIMPPETPDNIRTYKLSLDGTATTWSGGTWTLNGESADAPTSGFVEIEATASTALTVDQAVNLADLKVRGGTDIVVNVSTNGAGSLYALKATVESGVLQQGSPAVLGATLTVVVEDGATFDLNGKAVNAANAVVIAGAGAGDWPWALTSSSGAGGAILGGLYLSANATIGGANELKVGEWSSSGYYCYLQGFTLTKTGAGGFKGTNMNTPGAGTIDLQCGTMSVNLFNNLNNNGGNTTVIVESGASLQNNTDRAISIYALKLEGGALISNNNKPFKVNGYLLGSGSTAKLDFGPDVYVALTGDLEVSSAMTLDGDVFFFKDSFLVDDLDVTLSGTLTASSGTIFVGDGVTLNLATNRPAATLDIADGAALVVRMQEGEQKVSLSATGKPSSVILLDADGNHVSTASVSFADGTLVVAPPSALGSISINFHHGTGLDTTAVEGKTGLAGCKVYLDAWNNVSGNNNSTLSTVRRLDSNGETVTSHSMSVTVSGTRGSWACDSLNAAADPLCGYIDDNASYPTPTVTVTGIPYDKYRVVVYHSTDTASVPFGYDLVNGIPFTGVSGHTSVGTANWGDSGPSQSANPLEEGVNVLVTPILPNNAGKTLTVTGHRVSGTGARGCIAAIQIFDATDDTNIDMESVANHFGTILGPDQSNWQFPDDGVVADPSGFGGVMVGTNGISQILNTSEGYRNSTISVLASIPEKAAGTLFGFRTGYGNDIQVTYRGDGTFLLTHDGNAAGVGGAVVSRVVDVSGVHAYTLKYTYIDATLYQDGTEIAATRDINATSFWLLLGSLDIGMRNSGGEVLSGMIVYAAYTHYWTTDVNNASNLFSTYDHSVFRDADASIAKKAEVFTHLVGCGDTEGLLALMPHRTSTYEDGAWHCPLDAHFADGEYVDGLAIATEPVTYNLLDVTTNAVCASVLAKIADPTKVGTLVSFFVNRGSRIDAVYNGDGKCYIRWGDGDGYARAWTDVLDVSGVHVWSLVYRNDGEDGTALYCDGVCVASDSVLHWSGSNGRVKGQICFGVAANGARPMQGLEIYAVHTDFGADATFFSEAGINSAAVFNTFDFMAKFSDDTIAEKLAAFEYYAEAGRAYDPSPVVTTDTVLHISEICPKPTARDPNGVEAGWVEIHNTSDTFAANLSDYSLTTANRGSEIKGAAALPDVLVRPGEYKIVYTTKEYPKDGINDGSTPFITNGIIVAQLKINPKKFPVVQLRKGKEVVDSFIVPVDLPDNASFAPAGGSWGDYSGETVEPAEEEIVEPAEEIEIGDSLLDISSSVAKNEEEGFYSFANVTNGKEGILIDKSATELMAEKDMYSISLTFRVTNNTAQSESTGMPLFFCRNSNTSAPYSGILAYINKAPYGNIIIQIRDAGKSNRDYQVDSELDWLDGEWHTLEVSCGQTGSSRIAVSVDGVKYVDTTCGVAAKLNTNMPMCIGRAYDSSSWTAFTGDIKDIHLYTGDAFPAPLPDPAEETSDKTEIVDATTVTRVILPTITPGSANNRAGEIAYGPNAGPLYGIKHKVSDWKAWAQAKVGENYSVTLALNPMDDDPTNAIQSVSLAYRTDFSSIGFVTMEKGECVENEGQLWTATIPGSAITQAGHILRWAAVATDAAGNKWRTPSFCDPDNAYEWYGTLIEPPADLISEKLQTFHIFADSTAQANMDKQYDSISGAIPYGARVQIYDSQTGFYYDNVRIDLRGNTTAGFRKKSHGIRFIKSQPLTCTNPFTGELIDGLRKVSFIAEYSDPSFIRQALAFQLFKDMGLKVPYSYPVRLNMNGEFFQMAFHSNRFTDELIEDYYGLDPLGYAYKSVGTLRGATSAGGTEKKTPDDGNERDLSVLSAFYGTFSGADNISESFDGDGMDSEIPAVTKTVVKKFDLPAWLNYLAAARITQECDDVWANLCAYYDVNGTDTWMPLGYDFNVSFGAIYLDDSNYKTYKYPIDQTMANVDNFKSHPFYGGNRVRCHRYNSDGTINYGNRGFEAVWQSPKFRRLYLRRLRTVMDEQLKTPGTTKDETPFWSNYVVAYTNAITADAALDRAKWGYGNGTSIYWWPNALNLEEGIADLWDNYVVPRRQHLFVTHSVNNTEKTLGYGKDFNAGIPDAQSPLADLKAGFSVDNTTDETKTAIDDAEKIVIRNANAEAVDMSGWRLTGRFVMTLPAGTVVDSNDTITVVVDRKTYVATHDAELTDQVIVGNAKLAADTTSFTLFDANGTEVVKVAQPSNESKFLRILAWDGIPVADDDNGTDEWVTLTNISDTVTLDLTGVNVKIGKDTTAPKCNITLTVGTLLPGGTITLRSSDFGLANGWEKITNGAIYLQLTDANGTIGLTSEAIAQKSFAGYEKGNVYLQVTSFGASFGQGDIIAVPYPVTTVEVVPGEDAALEATTPEEAEAALADCEIVLSDEDKKEGLVTNVLKLVAVPVVSVDPQTGVETTTYVARVDVDEAKVHVPTLGQIEEGETTVDPLTVESDEGGSKVTVGVSNATVGLWYGFIWTDSLGDKPFENDVESFKRATSTSVKIESKAEAAKSAQKAFFRVKVSASKP